MIADSNSHRATDLEYTGRTRDKKRLATTPLPPPIHQTLGPEWAEVCEKLQFYPDGYALSVPQSVLAQDHPILAGSPNDEPRRVEIVSNAPITEKDTVQDSSHGNVTLTEGTGLVRLSDVQPEKVSWLWPGRIPLGKLTIIDGDPGLGKSLITCDIAARVSKGAPMPDGTASDLAGPAGVIFMSCEDGIADTIRPRMDAAGADTTRIAVLEYVKDGAYQRLPTIGDLHDLERSVDIFGAALVVIDPMMAHLPSGINAHKDQDMRSTLSPLAKFAEKAGVAIVIIRHLNKGISDNVLHKGGGSMGIIGAARVGLIVAADPQDMTKERRILATSKNNLARNAPAFAYHIISVDGTSAPTVIWEGPTEHMASDLLGVADDNSRSAITEAEDFLRDLLINECTAQEVFSAGRKAGLSEPTLKRAKRTLGVVSEKRGVGKDGYWIWKFPK